MTNGVAIPHIGAGINLNMPVIGPILRRGSAFFLRRTFKGDPLYSTVFREYISQLFARGVSLEYFIEGGRSRTGRLLAPRGGMLSMTLRSFLRESRRPVVFQPVYIGYEKIMEGDAYIGELSGKPKEKESLLGFFKAFGALRQHYGRVALNFGEPIFLRPLLDEVEPEWETATQDPEAKPEWLNRAVDELATRILENVNRAAHVNPINLLAISLLPTPKHAMTEADLAAQIDLGKALLAELPYSDRVTMTDRSAAQIIAYGEKMGWIRRTAHPLGDVLSVDDEQGVLLSYFRNNVTHLFATAAGSRAASSTTGAWRAHRSCVSAGSSIRSSSPSCSCRGPTRNSRSASRRRSISSSRAACSASMPKAASSRAKRARAIRRSACARSGATCCRRSSAITSASHCW